MIEAGGTIAPNAFLRTAELLLEVSAQVDPEWNDDGLLVIDIDEPKKEYGSADEDAESDARAEADGRRPPTRRVVGR